VVDARWPGQNLALRRRSLVALSSPAARHGQGSFLLLSSTDSVSITKTLFC
jgi:hypothetical protein